MRPRFTLSLILTGLLLGCGAAPSGGRPDPSPAPVTDPPATVSPAQRTYSLTVPIDDHAAREDIEAHYGGSVVVWQPAQGFAVLGLGPDGAGRASGGTLEQNRDVFSGSGQLATRSGSVSAWAGGSVSAWAGGMVSAWAGGQYAPVPQNTAKWQRLGLQAAQVRATRLGAGVKVAVIDSGLDLTHPAFQGALAPAAEGWDYVDADATPQEEGTLGTGAYGHGTSVAGIILQIAPRATLLPLRVLGPDGSGDVLNVAAAIERAVNLGAQVINLSLGSDERSEAVANAVAAATARDVYVVASSGNSADERVTFPASLANLDGTTAGLYTLSVGSVNDADRKSAFSTYGAALELVAPGEQVYGPVPGTRLGAWSGTSMAAPMVAGALALALGERAAVPASTLISRLKGQAVNIYQHEQNPGLDDLLGSGRLAIDTFLNVALP